jgi:hypothetical protein
MRLEFGLRGPEFVIRKGLMRFSLALVACVLVTVIYGCSSTAGSVPPNVTTSPAPGGRCAGVPVTPVDPGSVYVLPDGASGIVAKCQVLASIKAGAFVVAYGTERPFLDTALGAEPAVPRANRETTSNGTPQPGVTQGPIPSPIPTWPPGEPTPSPRPNATPGPITALAYEAEAVVRVDGVLRTYDVASDDRSELDGELKAWEAAPTSGPTPPPANKVWSLIGTLRQEVIGPRGGFIIVGRDSGKMNLLTDIWRLSTNDRHYDYFMVAAVMSTTPNYAEGVNNSCWPTCEFWTWRRHQLIRLRDINGLLGTSEDLGPPNGIAVNKVSFSVGANLSGKIGFNDKGATGEGNGGINASYSNSWDQPHATTTSKSNVGSTVGEWQDDTLNFMSGPTYDFYGWKNITTTAEFRNGRVAIFRLPRNADPTVITPDLTNYFLVRGSVCTLPPACFFTGQAPYIEIHITSTQTGQVWLPTFSVDTTTLKIKPQTSATFRIKVRSSEGESTKNWHVVKDPNDNHLTVTPSSGSDSDNGTNYQTITVKAQPGAVPGTTYTLYVNTVPAGGADALRFGSLRVTVHIE